MMKRILTIAMAVGLAIPALLSAQAPSHATVPKARRATHVRGEALGLDNRPVAPTIPATRATRATPAQPGAGPDGRAIPATPATPAGPALEHRPPQAGTGHGRKP